MTLAVGRKRLISFRTVARRSISYSILISVTLLVSLPAFWFLVTSLKLDTEYLSYPIRILPKEPQWENYVKVFSPDYGRFSFMKHAVITLFLALVNTIPTIITSAMGGFAFSRMRGVPGREKLFMVIIALLIIPSVVYLIPQFILYQRLHLTNTYWPWILGGLTANPFYIFMFRQFFATFPKELEDAAEVDGCGPFGVFWRIFLPNAKPAAATAFIFSFQGIWSDYVTPVIYLEDAKTTLAVKLANAYVTPHGDTLTTVTLAANVIFVLPLVVLFFLGQRHIIRGMVTTGLKG